MRDPIRLPSPRHPALHDYHPSSEEPEEDRFIGRPCYTFNRSLRPGLDDTRCGHCAHYLTARCPHIDEFLDDVEDLSPD
ncbi:MAG TPA: hypothetical protein VEY07_01535 [Thermoplasmata archaeon]|nr:hypothetical protein [Thermoplasmata archaeon]